MRTQRDPVAPVDSARYDARMDNSLLTLAETSNFTQTGRTDEVEVLCAGFARTWPDAVRSFEYGRSAEGRALRALCVTRARGKVPVLMIQAGIHPGERDGKD